MEKQPQCLTDALAKARISSGVDISLPSLTQNTLRPAAGCSNATRMALTKLPT
jgi:hypothetical protein